MRGKQYGKTIREYFRSYDDPYLSVKSILNKYGEKIPKVARIPTLSEYNLPEDIESVLQGMEDGYNKRLSIIQRMVFIAIMGASFLYGYIKYDSVETGFGIVFCALIAYGFIFGVLLDGAFRYKHNSDLHKKYFEYRKQLDCYHFWGQMETISYWMNLDGNEFEEAVALVYRKNGYDAEVSRRGGDGGVDIVLRKGGKVIAVQCKAHKKPVGPSVVRDLFGTMNHLGFSEGILVSRDGFTSGVREFVLDKPIKRVNLNDLLAM